MGEKGTGKKKTGILDHIMGGITYMIPCVVAGGLLMAIGYLLDDYSINPANYGYNTELASFFTSAGSVAFSFMLAILAAFIGRDIAGDSAIVAGLVGGYLANQGGSGFLGAILAGFVAGYAIKLLEKIFKIIPETLETLKKLLLYPLLSVLIIAVADLVFITPCAGYINQLLNDGLNSLGSSSQILLGIVLGGMAATDMGGPINKAANLFAIAAMANGNYYLIAANLAGCFVPPYVIAIGTTLYKKKFTREQRTSGMTAYVIGLAGVTESAIPVAMTDPFRIIPSCAVGSAIAGGLSMMFGCSVMAPFGGVFILPLNSNPLGYIVSLVAGIAAGVAVLGLLKHRCPDVAETEIVDIEEKTKNIA